jgi:hypothetical protein
MNKLFNFGILFLLLAGCITSPDKQINKSNQYLHLSTEEQETNDSVDSTLPDSNSVQHQGEEIQQQPTEQPLQGESPGQDSQQVIPVEPHTQEELRENEIRADEVKVETIIKLPFQDFKERWNAVTEEQMSNLYIHNLEKVTKNNTTYYRSELTRELELLVFEENGYVQSLELVSKSRTKPIILSMLTGWNQIINILHPGIEIYDVDILFNMLGVGPNGDLTGIKDTIISHYDLSYEVTPIEGGYFFKASYNR